MEDLKWYQNPKEWAERNNCVTEPMRIFSKFMIQRQVITFVIGVFVGLVLTLMSI